MRAAVLGAPIAPSLSPVLHRAAYGAPGLTGGSYQAIEGDTTRLPAVLDDCGPDWAGLSLTMQLNGAVLPLHDHLAPPPLALGRPHKVAFPGDRRRGPTAAAPGIAAPLASAGVP